MKKYILSLDQGTTSSRAILFDKEQNIIAMAQKEFAQFYPEEGWVEHDPMEILASQREVMETVLSKSGINLSQLAGIGIGNQRETTILWEKSTGLPIYNAIVWQCRRSSYMVDELCEMGLDEHIKKTTGLVPDAYFSATKIRWILDKVPNARARAKKGEILFGTVDSWLLWNLTNGKVHATDYTNASRTMLYNIHEKCWDETLLNVLDIPKLCLPEVKDSSTLYGHTLLHGKYVPIAGIAGDQQAALFGQCCFEKGACKNTYGTGCFLLMNTGDTAVESQNGLLTTVAIGLNGKLQYALEGSVFMGGAVIQWLRDELGLIHESRDAEYFASKVPDTAGVYLVPAFAGLGAPHWDMYARGCLMGLTRGVKREHIIRAAQESIAYQSLELVQAMNLDTGLDLKELKVDGGASRDAFLMQFQADILNSRVLLPKVRESTALGVAYLAGLATGVWESKAEISAHWQMQADFKPNMDTETRTRLLHGWHKAVQRSAGWAQN